MVLTGAEITLRQDLPDLARRARDAGFSHIRIQRNVPANGLWCDTNRSCERHHCFEGMFAASRRDALVSEQPLKVLRSSAIEAEPYRGTNRTIKEVDPH